MDVKKYYYNGPVMGEDHCVQENWEGETMAVSERKAKSNLTYRWKMQHGYAPTSKISLPCSLSIIR